MCSMSEKKSHSESHIKTYVVVWAALLALTALTVWFSTQDYGNLNMVVAMLIATVKGSLVCLFFMHLKYENRLNRVVFISAFVFFGIFGAFSVADELTRPIVAPPKIMAIQEPAGNAGGKMEQLRHSTPELVSKGKELYQINCVACHGPQGHGDGPAAAAMNPKPRNFTQAVGWKQGRAPAQVFTTLTKGFSIMPSFSNLSVEDRWALAHYVLSLGPNPPPEDTADTLALIGLQADGKPSLASPQESSVELPILFIIDRMAEEANKNQKK